MGVPLVIIHFYGIFSIVNHPLLDTSIYGNFHIAHFLTHANGLCDFPKRCFFAKVVLNVMLLEVFLDAVVVCVWRFGTGL